MPDNWSLALMQTEAVATQYNTAVVQESRTITQLSDLGMALETLTVGGISHVEFNGDNSGFTITYSTLSDDGVTPYWLQYAITAGDAESTTATTLNCYNSNLPSSWWPSQCQQEWAQ